MQQQQTERWTQQMQQMYERVAGWLKGFWQTLCTLLAGPAQAGAADGGSGLCRDGADPSAPGRASRQRTRADRCQPHKQPKPRRKLSVEQQLAENLGRMLGQLEGAGECQVMVTLRQSLTDGVRQRAEQPRTLVRGNLPHRPGAAEQAGAGAGTPRGDPPAGGSNAGSAGVLVVCPGANSARVCQQIPRR